MIPKLMVLACARMSGVTAAGSTPKTSEAVQKAVGAFYGVLGAPGQVVSTRITLANLQEFLTP